MAIPDRVEGILIGAAGSFLWVVIVYLFLKGRSFLGLFGFRVRLAYRLASAGITRFHLSRDEYGRTLRTYLSQARRSIAIVSVSLKVTHDESDLVELFRQRLSEFPDFRVQVSLIRPGSPAVDAIASALNMEAAALDAEIRTMLQHLHELQLSLPENQRARLRLMVHDVNTMGSAILLDADPATGIIQVETKLYRSPRTESFSFEVKGPSSFYQRNYRAWSRILDDATPLGEIHIGAGFTLPIVPPVPKLAIPPSP